MLSDIENDMWALMSDEITLELLEKRQRVRNELRKTHTRQLLNMRITWAWHFDLPHEYVLPLLYEELGRREHIPNKVESRKLRKQLIKQGTSNRGSKREPKKKARA